MVVGQTYAFRVDASVEIGSGHVMRCLTLADALMVQGAAACFFITRPHTGHMDAVITARGYSVVSLDLPDAVTDYGAHPAPPAHAHWLGGDWPGDAAQTARALHDVDAGWLIMDHYALDATWQDIGVCGQTRLYVLDDLADRPHLADGLMDHVAGRQAADYDPLVSSVCVRHVGLEFALLRPEFAALRSQALARRDTDRVARILVTMGGVDKDNITGAVLDALAQVQDIAGIAVDVVMGVTAPHLACVCAQAAAMPFDVTVHVAIMDMAQKMVEADLAIGAIGATSWERFCLGLPTVSVAIAENQKPLANTLARQTLTYLLPPDDLKVWVSTFQDVLADGPGRKAMGLRCAQHVDGGGAPRVAQYLTQTPS